MFSHSTDTSNFQQTKQPRNPPVPPSQKKLKLCFCPLCEKGRIIFSNERDISWTFIAKVIMYSLSRMFPKQTSFSLQYEITQFVYDHFYLFDRLDQFHVSKETWQNELNKAFQDTNVFQINDADKSIKLINNAIPWVDDRSQNEFQQSPQQMQRMPYNQYDMMCMQGRTYNSNGSLEQVREELRQSYIKTLQIAKVTFNTCQDAYNYYSDPRTKHIVCYYFIKI